MFKDTGGIYKIRNIDSSKIYIGATSNLSARWNKHLNNLRCNKHPNKPLQEAFNIEGKDKFLFEIIERCSIELLKEREDYWIKFYDACNPEKGYNIVSMSSGNTGRRHTEETREKIRQTMIGRKKSKETKIKIANTLSNKLKRNEGAYRAFSGHVTSIYKSVEKYAYRWKLPVSDIGDFRDWSYKDDTYEELFNIWKENGFNKFDIPVVMRSVKKYGFVIDNLIWARKGSYSWWGEEYEVLKELQTDIINKQPIANEGIEGQKEVVKKSMKGKRYSK